MAAKPKLDPKRVVYLWGAGATHAEAQRLGSTVSLLMRDTAGSGEGITTRILRRAGREIMSSFSGEEIGNVDIEKLISLLAGSGTKAHSELAERLREIYFIELKKSLVDARILGNINLATDLLRMHNNSQFRREAEILMGIISTNHDGLLQLASQTVYGAINPGIRFTSRDYKFLESVPLLLQLHGSFTWKFGMPIKIQKLRPNSPYEDAVWIPPTILKESKSYPYNKLSGLAYELLARHCDVLRVVGTSLTQNDWNILSLIFNAQRHREMTKGEPFLVELIMPQEAGEQIKRDCAYLKNVISIGFLTEGRFSEYKTPQDIPAESDLNNPFAYWLSQKQEFHRDYLTVRPEEAAVAQIGASA